MKNRLFGIMAASLMLLFGQHALKAMVSVTDIDTMISEIITNMEETIKFVDTASNTEASNYLAESGKNYLEGRKLVAFSLSRLGKKLDETFVRLTQKIINKRKKEYEKKLQNYKQYIAKMLKEKNIGLEHLKKMNDMWKKAEAVIGQNINLPLPTKQVEQERTIAKDLVKNIYEEKENFEEILQLARDTFFVKMLKNFKYLIDDLQKTKTIADLQKKMTKGAFDSIKIRKKYSVASKEIEQTIENLKQNGQSNDEVLNKIEKLEKHLKNRHAYNKKVSEFLNDWMGYVFATQSKKITNNQYNAMRDAIWYMRINKLKYIKKIYNEARKIETKINKIYETTEEKFNKALKGKKGSTEEGILKKLKNTLDNSRRRILNEPQKRIR